MNKPLGSLRSAHPERVRAVLNILIEAPYFYRSDNEDLFFFLRRHRQEFASFYEDYYGWILVLDDKCARVHKNKWYNASITEANRDLFDFRRRDDCLAFMILLEFFEHQLEEHSLTVEDRENLRFRIGDLLLYTHRRFHELFPAKDAEKYTEEYVRGQIIRHIMPTLERYRFVKRLPPPEDVELNRETDMIFEALPALYHYNAGRLSRPAVQTGPAEAELQRENDSGS